MKTSIKYVNITPHAINLIGVDGSMVDTIYPSGVVARVDAEYKNFVCVDGIEFKTVVYGKVANVPESAGGTVFIVSAMVRDALYDRYDIASPGELVRDAEGKPIGCRGLVFNAAFK